MTVEELDIMLNEIDNYWYESGAYYDQDFALFIEHQIALIENTYQLSVIEF